jgi:hypothetical protein
VVSEPRSVTPPAPEPTRAPESIPVDRTPSEILQAQQNWTLAKQDQYEVALSNEAKRRGFDQVKWSVSATVSETISQARPITDLQRTLIVAAGDVDLKVSQVLGKGKALVLNEDGSIAYLVKAPAEKLYEGTPIDQIAAVWRVRGVTSYTSFRGAKQAFLLEPQLDFDVAAQEWDLATETMVRPDGSVSVANLLNDQLRECIDFASIKGLSSIKDRTHLVALRNFCADSFTRPPVTTCVIPGKVSFFGYIAQLTEAECTDVHGEWSTTIAPSAAE